MQLPLTTEQILALAPDPGAAAAGRGQANPRSWSALGRAESAVWGECKGSAKEPYRTQVDLSGPAFRCSCPSRKFPCKHGLGLLLLLAANPELAPLAEPPAWVSEWLAGRARTADRRQSKPEPATPEAPAAPSRVSRSAGARETRVAAGLADLELWLRDRLRSGLATLQSEAPGPFDSFAARMVDAQAPGVARLLRVAAAVAASGEGWQERLLDQLARLHLLARAYARIAELPAATQADVRAAVGFTQSQEELLAGAGVRDHWLVLGRKIEDEERLRVQRTWLWGLGCARPALVLDFSAAGQPLDRSLVPGSGLDAELVFYPGALPLRALVRTRYTITGGAALPASPLREAVGAYAAALSANPWTERSLVIAGPCGLTQAGERWQIVDEDGFVLPLPSRFDGIWVLLALTGGRPFNIAGEWDGVRFTPLCAQYGEQLIILGDA